MYEAKLLDGGSDAVRLRVRIYGYRSGSSAELYNDLKKTMSQGPHVVGGRRRRVTLEALRKRE